LLGPSGCGKSTLLNLIAGLDAVTSGDISIDGRVVNDVHAKDRDVAMVFQSYALYPTMNVRRNITFGLEMRGVPRAERYAAAQRAAEILHISHLLDRKPSQLSGGQRQRVAMGRALVRQPKVFLFDEPLSNLDAQLRTDMRTEIKRLHQRLRTTVIYVTHDQIEAMTMATHVAVMRDGEVVQFGSPGEIYERPATIFVAKFVGSPPMNFLRGRLTVEDGRPCVDFNDRTRSPEPGLVVPLGETAAIPREYSGREIVVGVRPEAISIDRGSHSKSASARWLVSRQVDVIEPTGADTLAIFAVQGMEMIARLRSKEIGDAGQTVQFAIPVDAFHLFDPVTDERIDLPSSGTDRSAELVPAVDLAGVGAEAECRIRRPDSSPFSKRNHD
jgi:multiple sugar transport system ATP-binding protein